jgi:serine/threonine protein kinase
MEQIVGSYRIGSEIGRGSFATVYKGHNTVSFLCFVVFAFSSLASGAVVRGVVLFADKPIATLELLQTASPSTMELSATSAA